MNTDYQRPQDWPARLQSYVAERSERPRAFAWGSNDCVHFAAGWLVRLGYPDPLAGFSAWTSPLGAARVIRAAGGFGPAVAERMADLGCPVIPPLTAGRGDLVLLQIDARRQALGVVIGATAATSGPMGVSFFPLMNRAVCAWRT